jgi:hypothetical protein
MFEGLLRGIFERNGLDDVNAKAQYLRELQTQARGLWKSYQTQNVLADYSQAKTQVSNVSAYGTN